MSLANKVARAQYMGDPGLFGFIGKAVKGAVKTIPGVGQVVGAVEGLIGGGGRPAVQRPIQPAPRRSGIGSPLNTFMTGLSVLGKGIAAQQQRTAVRSAQPPVLRVNPPFGGAPGMGFDVAGRSIVDIGGGGPRAGVNGQMTPTGLACPPGFRANKSDYWLKNGTYVPKGTRCVRIRRRNPLNPRALDRATSRVASFARADKGARKKVKKAARKID